VLDGLLPLRGQQGGDVPDGDDDVYLGRLQRAHRPPGLLGIGRREQLVRDDRGLRGLLRLPGQDVPFPSPGAGRVGWQLLDPAQILAGPEMILWVVAGQDHSLGRQFGPVAPHHLLQEGGAGLRLADVQEDPRVRAGAGGAADGGGGRGGGSPGPGDVMRCQPDTSRVAEWWRLATAIWARGVCLTLTRKTVVYPVEIEP